MGYGEDLKNIVQSTTEVSDVFKATISDAKQGKTQVGAVVRLIALAIAWLNQIAVTFGGYTVPHVNEEVIYLIATVITFAVSAYTYWKNNSWTTNAKTADAVMTVLNNTGITIDDLAEAVGKLMDDARAGDRGDTTEADDQ